MKKLGMVLGVAAVATLAGCKDPDYKYANGGSQNEVKNVATQETTVPATEVAAVQPVEKHCHCAPGTRHTSPCTCGAPDCMCIVETKPVAPAVQPEYTTYVVQSGDYLSKISKKFNVRIDAIRKANDLKKDVIRVGQKLKIPGKVEVGEQKAPAVQKTAPAAKTTTAKVVKTTVKKVYVPYTGATKEYVVKSGDTLGVIAYSNGLNIRQLKELNGLKSDALKIGQKLKVPVDAQAAKAATEQPAAKKPEVVTPEKTDEAPEVKPVEVKPVEEDKKEAAAPVAPQVQDPGNADAVSQPATISYVVREGDDFQGLSMNYGVSPAEIRELNGMGENDQLEVGKTIKLPASAQQ